MSSPGIRPTTAAAVLALAGSAALHGAPSMQPPAGDGASPVTGFTLVYAAGGAPDPDVGAIADGATLDLSAFPVNSFTIRADADASGVIGSVRLQLEGPVVAYRTKDRIPYALYQEHPPGDYEGRVLADGDYRITATPYTGPDQTGDRLALHTVRFSVTGAPAVLPEQLTRLDILEFLRDGRITSVEDFIAALPLFHRRHFVLVFESGGLASDFVSGERPRVVSWGTDARFVLSWGTDPESPFRESVEFLSRGRDRWVAGVIDFSGEMAEIREPAVCSSCHGSLGKPLWGQERYAGTEDATTGAFALSPFVATAYWSSLPRLSALQFGLPRSASSRRLIVMKHNGAREFPDRQHLRPTFESSATFAWRHAEVLFGQIAARPDYARIAGDMMCRDDAFEATFPVADHHLAVLEDGGLIQDSSLYYEDHVGYSYIYGDLFSSLALLIVHDLGRRNAGVAEALRGHEDELRRIHRQHFGAVGRAFLIARFDTEYPGGMAGSGIAIDALARDLRPRVCAALRGGEPELEGRAGSELAVAGFTLVDAAGRDVRVIEEGDVVDLTGPDAVAPALRADLAAPAEVEAMELALAGAGGALLRRLVDDSAPYLLDAGDGAGGPLPPGDYYLSARPRGRAGPDGDRDEGHVSTIRFSVTGRPGDDPAAGGPRVGTVALTSDPGPDAVYALGDEIEAAVRFDRSVTVSGAPGLALTVGGAPRPMRHRGGSGDALTFAYTVAEGDLDADGVSIAADSLSGTIGDGAGEAAVLTHAAVAADAGHRVDGVRPVLQGVVADGEVVLLTYDEALSYRFEHADRAGDAFTVTTDGDTVAVERAFAANGSEVWLALSPPVARGQDVTVSYTPGAWSIRDAAGNGAAAFADRPATNETGMAVYDADRDGLIEITTLAQLDAMRHDLDGDGDPTGSGAAAYRAAFSLAFPDGDARLRCAGSCTGYELLGDLDFDTNGSGGPDAGDAWWNGGAGWEPIGTARGPFRGTLEGNGRTIRHMFIHRPATDHVGLFGHAGWVGSASTIRGVGVIEVDVTGNDYVGALVGHNRGVVTASHAAGPVSGRNLVGGLVGGSSGARITASYATGPVSGNSRVGGLVGLSTRVSAITASYATGPVSGGSHLGGLVGRNDGFSTVTASYATGPVSGRSQVGGLVGLNVGSGTIAAGYWDTSTSGRTTGADGRTTAQLQAPTDYGGIYAGWNVDVDHDGVADDPWHFGTAGQYPALKADLDGDGTATWQEFGHQLRAGPTLTVTAGGRPVALSWTAVDTSHWTPAPRVTYAVYRTAGGTVERLASGLDALAYRDTTVPADAALTYQVAAEVSGGEATRSAWAAVTVRTPPNRGPEAVGALGALTVRIADGAATVDVSGAFLDPDGDPLTYAAASSAPGVATVEMLTGAGAVDVSGASRPVGSTLTVTPLAAGETTVTVTATDAVGSGGTATQSFRVTVPAPEEDVEVDYDADDDGLIEVVTLAQLDAVRHDLDGDGVPAGSGAAAHAAAFPDAAERMGCPAPACVGYELAADLDFDTDGSGAADAGDAFWNGGAGWRPLGTFDEPFTAVFAGNGRTVSYLFVRGGDNAGLFGMSSGVIRGVGVVTADVTGSRCAGVLAGLNGGRVEASYATGVVTGESCVGGLVGVNGLWVPGGGTFRPLEGSVTASWSAAAATAEKWVGGLIGYNNGTVAASYAAGDVTATTAESGAGGLVGRMGFGGNRITASYATGAVSGPGGAVGGLVGHAMSHDRVTASYWNTETSGLTASGGGAGQTTAALQEPTEYAGLYAAWDVDVDGDGVSDAPWDFGTSSAYPALSVDVDGDGAATWQEFGLQGRAVPPPAASGAGAPAGGARARAQAGGARARAQAGGTAALAAFTDDPLVPGVTPVRAVHLLELRSRIDGLRRRAGLPAFGWTDAKVVPGVTPARAVHLTELRSALGEAYAAAGLPAPGYTDAAVTAVVTALRAVQLQELRAAVAALESAPVPTGP